MKTLTDTELAGFRPVPREMIRPTDEDRRAIREQFRSGVRKKVTNATFQAVNGEDSPRFQKLRQQPLRVAYYICYNGSVPIDRMTAQALKRPFEALLRNTPSWAYGVFFVDQCDPSTSLMKRPAFAKMLDANNADLLLCKSMNGLTSAGVLPYYVFQCRPAMGVMNQFQVPLLDGQRIIDEAKAGMNGQAKQFRYVMSHITGKIEILGRPSGDEMLFKYHQAKYPKDASRFFTVNLAEDQCWLPNEIN